MQRIRTFSKEVFFYPKYTDIGKGTYDLDFLIRK